MKLRKLTKKRSRQLLQIESLTGKSLILTGKIRRIDFANKWGEEP